MGASAMLSSVIQDSLNNQINAELNASYSYLAMSGFCKDLNFHGFAAWLGAQSREEYGHAMKLYDFVIARGGQVTLFEIPAPKVEFGSVQHLFEEALEQEISVSQCIDSLYELAFKEKAFAATVELQWFIQEQVEEEHTFRTIVSKLNLTKDDPSALLDLDRELGNRQTAQ
jgi:ferritin